MAFQPLVHSNVALSDAERDAEVATFREAQSACRIMESLFKHPSLRSVWPVIEAHHLMPALMQRDDLRTKLVNQLTLLDIEIAQQASFELQLHLLELYHLKKEVLSSSAWPREMLCMLAPYLPLDQFYCAFVAHLPFDALSAGSDTAMVVQSLLENLVELCDASGKPFMDPDELSRQIARHAVPERLPPKVCHAILKAVFAAQSAESQSKLPRHIGLNVFTPDVIAQYVPLIALRPMLLRAGEWMFGSGWTPTAPVETKPTESSVEPPSSDVAAAAPVEEVAPEPAVEITGSSGSDAPPEEPSSVKLPEPPPSRPASGAPPIPAGAPDALRRLARVEAKLPGIVFKDKSVITAADAQTLEDFLCEPRWLRDEKALRVAMLHILAAINMTERPAASLVEAMAFEELRLYFLRTLGADENETLKSLAAQLTRLWGMMQRQDARAQDR